MSINILKINTVPVPGDVPEHCIHKTLRLLSVPSCKFNRRITGRRWRNPCPGNRIWYAPSLRIWQHPIGQFFSLTFETGYYPVQRKVSCNGAVNQLSFVRPCPSVQELPVTQGLFLEQGLNMRLLLRFTAFERCFALSIFPTL